MLSGIIGGQSVDAEEFGRAAVHVGIVMDEQFQCLAVRIPKPSGKEFLQYFAQHLGIQTPLIYISTEDEIDAMILRVSYAEKQKITVLKIIEKGLRSFGIQAGLSDLYEDLLLSRFYYTQARYALENGEASQSNDNLLLFEDCCLDYILYHCTGDLNSEMIWSKGFQKLVEHDRTKFRASYVETLRAYLDNNLNDNRSAVALQITRNSFLSRLERVNALLGENLKDPKVRFRYELAVLLYEKYKNE
jgi:sugar diacid utilization regulator